GVSLEFPKRMPTRLEFNTGPLRWVEGAMHRFDAWFRDGAVTALQFEGEGLFSVETAADSPTGVTRRRFHCGSLQRLLVSWLEGSPEALAHGQFLESPEGMALERAPGP